jgi:hypothetical protein
MVSPSNSNRRRQEQRGWHWTTDLGPGVADVSSRRVLEEVRPQLSRRLELVDPSALRGQSGTRVSRFQTGADAPKRSSMSDAHVLGVPSNARPSGFGAVVVAAEQVFFGVDRPAAVRSGEGVSATSAACYDQAHDPAREKNDARTLRPQRTRAVERKICLTVRGLFPLGTSRGRRAGRRRRSAH